SDADGDAISITATTLPAWLTLIDNGNGTATLSGTPSLADLSDNLVALHASDGVATATQSFTLVATNRAPMFASVAPTVANVGQVFTYNISATDADADAL